MQAEKELPALEAARKRFADIIEAEGLLDVEVDVCVAALTAEQAIGNPTRRDYPIIEGREVVIEAVVNGAKAHAFTDSPRDFCGTLRDVLALPPATNHDRAVFLATMNATLRSLGMLDATLHCRDDDPERCADEIARHVSARLGAGDVGHIGADQVERTGNARASTDEGVVGLIGLNPAIAEALVKAFGPSRVRITDLNPKNVGGERFGVPIWDGRTQTRQLIEQSAIVVVTGTTLVNGTFDAIRRETLALGKQLLPFGVTAAGVCQLLGWDRICPYARCD